LYLIRFLILKILLLDDEDDFRRVVRKILERGNYDVIEASDGRAGLKTMQSNRPDLIISDIRMPNMSGDEFFDQLQASGTDLNIIPLIFMSGHIDDEGIVKRLNGGAHLCLRKPISAKLLLAHVNSCLSASKRYSNFIADKLDILGSAVPTAVRHDFKPYRSLAENVDAYVNVIAVLIKAATSQQTGNRTVGQMSRMRYIRLYLEEGKRRQELVLNSGAEALTWQLIFLVAESQISDRAIYVSDLYVLAQAAKSTINNRITSLVADKIFIKQSTQDDRRRQVITMTKPFSEAFFAHIDETIQKITGPTP